MMGPERKSMVMPEEERKNWPYHEAGHALGCPHAAQDRPCAQGHHHSPRSRLGVTMQVGRRRPLQHGQGPHAQHHFGAVRWSYR